MELFKKRRFCSGAGPSAGSSMPVDSNMGSSAPSGVGEFFKSPLIQQYLLAAGAGMMNKSSFGQAVGSGIQNGSQAAINEIQRQQEEKMRNDYFVKQQQAAFTAHKQNSEYDKGEKQAEEQDQAISNAKLLTDNGVDITGLNAKTVNNLAAQLIDQQFKPEKQTTYVPVQKPGGGGVDWVDPKNPSNVYGGTQQLSDQPKATQPEVNTNNGGVVPPGWKGSVSTSKPLSFNNQEAIDKKVAETTIEQNTKQFEADRKLMDGDSSKRASILNKANNFADINNNLSAYEAQLGGHAGNPLIDNNVTFNAQAALGTNPIVSKLKQDNGQVMVDTIKSYKSENGIAPTQMMNTEKEWERQSAAAVGDGSIAARKEAAAKLQRAYKQDLIEHESLRQKAAANLGVEYKPLFDINTIPGPKIISMPTGNKPIGSTGKLPNGKKIRVIGPDQIEEVK
jgi:hypothetical protein